MTESQPITSDAQAEPSIDAVVADAAMLTASENLAPEVERLRRGLVGAADAIEDLEEPRMPPVIGPEHVIPAHVVADFVRIGRNLAREGLIHANVGAFSMIDPDAPGIVHATRQGAILARLTDQDLISGMLGGTPPEGHDPHWSVHEVLLASLSLQTEGRAACLHVHGPWTTTVSCEKDRIVCAPIDQGGKSRIGRVIIVDPDPEDAQAYLRQVAEALKQSQMVGVVVRGNGAFVIGRNFDEAWSNASVLEHSMHILLLAKQANLKI